MGVIASYELRERHETEKKSVTLREAKFILQCEHFVEECRERDFDSKERRKKRKDTLKILGALLNMLGYIY